jgi:peroxiredoxin
MATISPETLTLTIPTAGGAAPNATVTNLDGELVALASLWPQAPRGLALVFLRHFGCSFCALHARELQQHAVDFAAAGIDVAIVGCGSLAEAQTFQRDLGLTLPLYTDPARHAYAAYGVGEASVSGVLHLQNLIGGVKGVRHGFLPRRSTGNPRQLQGQFLIDRTGILRSVSRPVVMADIPSAADLLRDASLLLDQLHQP